MLPETLYLLQRRDEDGTCVIAVSESIPALKVRAFKYHEGPLLWESVGDGKRLRATADYCDFSIGVVEVVP